MRLSTSTNIMDKVAGVSGAIPLEKCLEKCSNAGYKVMDMNFCHVSGKEGYLTRNNWESWINDLAENAVKYDIEFSQSHNIIYNICDPSISNREWLEELTHRAIICSGELGVKWVVMHAGTSFEKGYSALESKKKNVEYFKTYADFAQKHNTGIAIENVFDFDGRQYTACVEELIDLVDSLNDFKVGICWDFSHANITNENQCLSLQRIGKRLKATHVADNNGHDDEHLAPFYGNINWEPIMKTLVEIGYEGDFTYEIQKFSENLPETVRDTMLYHTVDIGNYLLSMAR
ncbi:MAG TPA: sugar phosphate isomerase/epimerase [Clostridiales bacterium]|nr:sugar phosphate isomerase/epimerase [Clostridiales bacterium]